MFSTVRQLGATGWGNAMASAVVCYFIRAAKGFRLVCLQTLKWTSRFRNGAGPRSRVRLPFIRSSRTTSTYFVQNCGASTGPSRFARNQIYIGSESIGGSKISNDAVVTVSDYLLAQPEPLCSQPETTFLDSDSGASQSLALVGLLIQAHRSIKPLSQVQCLLRAIQLSIHLNIARRLYRARTFPL
jgi:hypothetical protein